MKELLHIRVFELKGDRYQLSGSFMTLEDYVGQELQNGYVVTDMLNFGIEKLRVTSFYAPANAKKQLESGSVVSNLTEVPTEEV